MEVFQKIKQQHGVSRKDFPGKNTGVGCHFPLQETFPTQGLNPHLLHHLHWQADSLPPSHQESPPRKEGNIKLVYAECRSTPRIWKSNLIGHLKAYGMPWWTTVWDICNIHLCVTSELHSLLLLWRQLRKRNDSWGWREPEFLLRLSEKQLFPSSRDWISVWKFLSQCSLPFLQPFKFEFYKHLGVFNYYRK